MPLILAALLWLATAALAAWAGYGLGYRDGRADRPAVVVPTPTATPPAQTPVAGAGGPKTPPVIATDTGVSVATLTALSGPTPEVPQPTATATRAVTTPTPFATDVPTPTATSVPAAEPTVTATPFDPRTAEPTATVAPPGTPGAAPAQVPGGRR